jgi:uncharacterized protein (TIGR03435 family)
MLEFRTAAACRVLAVLCCLVLLMPSLMYSQAATAPSFEVASIKPSQEITPALGKAIIASGKLHIGMSIDAARVDIGFMSLADLIPIAFAVKPYQVSGPEWMKVQRFDILAKMPDGATKEQVPEMLQALLHERFKLKVHRENRDYAVYGLVVGKGGSKLKETPLDTDPPASDAAPGGITFGDNPVRINAERGRATIFSGQNRTTKVMPGPDGQMRLEMNKMTMPAFAEMLTRLVDRPVIDMTELKGNFQIVLDLSMDTLMNVARAAGMGIPALGARGEPSRPSDASDPSSSSVFASVQQLGLRLESRRAPLEFIVVDQLEKMPTEN